MMTFMKKKTLSEKFITCTAFAATKALLMEVSATPKPGLVDRHNSGSHRDMDITTFQTSALTLSSWFYRFAEYGVLHRENEPESILAGAREIGVQAEKAMFQATGGINTHKGAVFSGGILCLAYGYLGEAAVDSCLLQETCVKISSPAMKDLKKINPRRATVGEQLYLEHGVLGIRGEAADGFPTVFQTGIPVMRKLLESGYSVNDAGILTLIHIMAALPDTNVMHRSSYEEALILQSRMKLLAEERPEKKDYRRILENLDQEFIRRNISPGGCADLLAMTYFVLEMEEILAIPLTDNV